MKVSQIKSKVAAKVAKGKAKVAKKCGKAAKCAALVFCLASLVLVGCQNPAQRAQTCTVNIYAYEKATVTLGTESVTLAQSNETGGNDAGLTASPKTDVSPEIAVGVGGSSAGVGSSGASKQGVGAAIGGAVDAVSGLFTGGSSDAAKEPTKDSAAKECADGSCTECADGSCEP